MNEIHVDTINLEVMIWSKYGDEYVVKAQVSYVIISGWPVILN